MTFPARGRRRILFSVAASAGLWTSALPAQQPPASTPAASAPAAPAAAKKAPAKSGASQADSQKNAESYSLGLMWGEQLRGSGITPETVSSARIAQGFRDGITGKATVSAQDRDNIRLLATAPVENNHHAADKFLAENGKKPGVVTTASGLEYQELRAGSGESPKTGDTVTVNYRGTLLNGTEFDSSYKRGQPTPFEVGHVIPGWNEALQLMKPGARWKLFIPPRLAYDLRSPPGIPPGSMLLFDVELISIQPASLPSSANPSPSVPPAPK